MKKWYTYIAFHNNDTFKVGYSYQVFERVAKQLTASASCFLCIRGEHDTKQEAIEAEKELKEVLFSFRIEDASCKEWHYSKKRGVKLAVIRALNRIGIIGFEMAEGLGVKSCTTWEEKPLEEIRKIIKKST